MSIRKERKADLSDFEGCVVVGAGQAGMNISETPDLLVLKLNHL